jgi:hypothetical protein
VLLEERELWLAVLPQFWYGLDDLTQQRAEALMGTLSEEYFEQGRVEGLAMGRSEGVLRILAVRGVSVDGKARQRIMSCTDLDTLALWLERAGTATHVSDALDGLSQ